MIAFVLATACGRIDYDPVADSGDGDGIDGPDAAGLLPIHEYHLNNDYLDDYGGPALTPRGGGFVTGGYQFGVNQGLSVAGAMPDSVYTVDVVFSFDTLGSWRKILDFKDLGTDEGLYTYDDHLQFVVVAGTGFENGTTVVTATTQLQVTLTRDAAGVVVGYVDRAAQFTFTDAGAVATLGGPGALAHFVIDDAATGGGEASGGVVRRIRIYDVALTETQLEP